MKNSNLIDEIKSQANGVLEKLNEREVKQFQIKDLEFDNGIFLNEMPIRGKALGGIMKTLKVRNNFTEFSNQMSPEDWNTVSRKIKTAEAETKMYAKVVKDDEGNTEIVDVYRHNSGKKVGDDASYQQYFNWITESLGNTETDYSLKNMHFNSKTDTFDLVLLNESNRVDVFGTDTDIWKTGDRFIFNGLRFDYAPFFERLVCSNGNTALQYGFGANITQAKFNNQRIKSIIEKNLVHGSEALPEQLQQAVQHLQQNNISIAEFTWFKRMFESRNENGKYDGLLSRYFNDQPFFKAYGVDINSKSNKWRSTADTGINAYNFFNMLTYVASHPEQVRMDRDDRVNLQIKASDLLFKKELDLEDIATKVKIDYNLTKDLQLAMA